MVAGRFVISCRDCQRTESRNGHLLLANPARILASWLNKFPRFGSATLTIEFNCPNCQKLLRTSDDKAGRKAKCPDCGTAVTVPQAASAPQQDDQFDFGEDVEEVAGRPPRRVSSSSVGGATKSCPVCGGTIKAAASRCKHCGEDLGGGVRSYDSGNVKPHRATMLLVFSILGWVFCVVFGIVAFFMARNDLEEMRAGTMDPSGEATTNAAKIISLVQLCLAAVAIIFSCVLFGISLLTNGNIN